MIRLQDNQCAALAGWFQPERSGGGLVAPHARLTGHGAWWVDRWPDPRLVMAATGVNYVLRGDPAAFPLHAPPALEGFIDASPAFLPVLQQAYREVYRWPRVLFQLDGAPPAHSIAAGAILRPLIPADAGLLARLAPDTAWIAETWGGAAGLAASGYAWGAFVDGVLVSVANSFFVGETCEDVGVVTEAPYRGRGYSSACSAALCREIQARGHTPTWGTSPDNVGSIRVAEKLGFRFVGAGELYVIGFPPPAAA
jgi:RimJ/RimL family protein N-acetyltransferase